MKLHELLHGSSAFYKQADYVESTKKAFYMNQAPLPSHVIETGNKSWRIAKQALYTLGCTFLLYASMHQLGSYFTAFQNLELPKASSFPLAAQALLFPFTFPKLIHNLVGLVTVPGSIASFFAGTLFRREIDIQGLDSQGIRIKRFSIEFDGYTIDAMMFGRPEKLENERWTLISGGNGEFYEVLKFDFIQQDLINFLDHLDSNAILFNYPGVGASSGFPDQDIMVKAYVALLEVLEDDIQAKTIFGYGHSIGAGVQAEALSQHEFKDNIRYLFMKSRTFADFAETVGDVLFSPLDFLIRFVRWNFETLKSSAELKYPELIFQTVKSHFYQDLSKYINDIISDPLISPPVSLAYQLLSQSSYWKYKFFMGIPEKHNDGFPKNTTAIAEKVEEMLKAFYPVKA